MNALTVLLNPIKRSERCDAGFPIVPERDRNGKRKPVWSQAKAGQRLSGKGDRGKGRLPLTPDNFDLCPPAVGCIDGSAPFLISPL
jgi:hypothetical protein